MSITFDFHLAFGGFIHPMLRTKNRQRKSLWHNFIIGQEKGFFDMSCYDGQDMHMMSLQEGHL